VHAPLSYHAPSSSAKTAIYPNFITNSLILEREEGQRIFAFLRKKGRGKNLPKGKVRSGGVGGVDRRCLNVQTEPWLGGLLVGGVWLGRTRRAVCK
jgi:hypothetical protein